MKLRTITLFAGLFVAQVSLAQVEEVGSVIDTTITAPVITTVDQAASEAELKAQKEQLKAQQKLQKEQEKALRAEEKAAKEKAKAEKAAQKKKENLSKANSEVSKVETKIAKAKADLAKEQSKFDIKKAKGTLSPQDEAKLKGKLLDKQQKINSLGLDLIKAKEKVNKYSM
jgi:hypothetical protein